MIRKGGLSEATSPHLEPSFLAVDKMVRLFYILLLGGRRAQKISLEIQREIVDVLHASAAAPAMVDGGALGGAHAPFDQSENFASH